MDFLQRTELLIGKQNISKLQNAKVAVCGLGGVGSAAAEVLARVGIGYLRLIDFDKVDITNLNRQLLATHETVGMYKTQAMAKRIGNINPACYVDIKQEFITPENIQYLLEGMDFVVDAIDNVTGKIAIIVYCKDNNIGIVSSMGTGNKIFPEKLEITDISKTSICPLARVMRRELKKRGIEKGLTVVYSLEQPLKTESVEGEKPVTASISFVPPVAGMLLSGYIVREIIGY